VSNQQRTHLSEQHLRSQNMQSRRTIEDRSITEELNHRGQIIRGEDTSRYAIDATHDRDASETGERASARALIDHALLDYLIGARRGATEFSHGPRRFG